MEERNKLEVGIGTIEQEKKLLQPKKVKIVRAEVVFVEKAKADKIVLHCKHPDNEDLIAISSASVLIDRNVIVRGLWYNLDKDNKLQKGSPITRLMDKYGIKVLKDFEGKEVDTELDKNYLVIKGY